MLSIKKKDKVVVIAGKDKGKQGEVMRVLSDKGRVVVAKVNFVKRHTRPTQQEPGGIHEKEAPISISNVMLVCPKCQQKTRPKYDILSDGKRVRICRRCNEMIA